MKTLTDIGHRRGRKALKDVANTAKPDTILGGYRKLVARKFDGTETRRHPGWPRIEPDLEQLVVRIAKENVGWGYDRIVGALANLGYTRRVKKLQPVEPSQFTPGGVFCSLFALSGVRLRLEFQRQV
jgi:hypothetical protein